MRQEAEGRRQEGNIKIVLQASENRYRVIIDENPSRKKAISFGLNVIGILGILLIAKKRGLIPTIQPIMDDLVVRAGFRVNQKLYLDILKSAQETDVN